MRVGIVKGKIRKSCFTELLMRGYQRGRRNTVLGVFKSFTPWIGPWLLRFFDFHPPWPLFILYSSSCRPIRLLSFVEGRCAVAGTQRKPRIAFAFIAHVESGSADGQVRWTNEKFPYLVRNRRYPPCHKFLKLPVGWKIGFSWPFYTYPISILFSFSLS